MLCVEAEELVYLPVVVEEVGLFLFF